MLHPGVFPLISALLFSLGCSPQPAHLPSEPPKLALRSYDVPSASAEAVRSSLSGLLALTREGKDSGSIGRADITPDGRLLVLAPSDIHAGVEALVESLGKRAPRRPATVTLTYWMVEGTPGKGATPVGLNDIGPALAEIERTDGSQVLRLAERVELKSLEGERGEVRGREARAKQRAWLGVGGTVRAELEVEFDANRIFTHVTLASGQTAVLAVAGAASQRSAPPPSEPRSSLYLLVRATHDGQGQ